MEAGQGISGEFADANVRNAVRRAARNMGVAGDERNMVTIRHTGLDKEGKDLVDQDVTVNEDLARAYALQKAEHDELVRAGKRDPRVNPMPHPERLYGGYYHGLVGVARRFETTPDVVEDYAEKMGGRTRRADVVAGLYGAGVQAEGSEKMTHHVDPSKATRLIDPLTGKNHPISKLPELKHMVAEMQPHPKTGVMGFMRSRNKYQTYITNPDTLQTMMGPQSFIGYNIENIGGEPTLIKREKPENEHIQGLKDFLKTEMASPTPMGSKPVEKLARTGRRGRGTISAVIRQSGGAKTETVGSPRSGFPVEAVTEPIEVEATEQESPVTKRKGRGKKASPTKGGTVLYQPVQKPTETITVTKPKSVSRQLQNVELDEAGNPKPYPPVVGVRGAEPYYVSKTAQKYNDPFNVGSPPEDEDIYKATLLRSRLTRKYGERVTDTGTLPGISLEEAAQLKKSPQGVAMSEINREAQRREIEDRFEGPKSVTKPRPRVLQGLLDFDQNLTDTETESRVDKERVVDTQTGKTISSQFNPVLGKVISATVEPQVQKRSTVKPEELAMGQLASSAYNKETGNVPRFGTQVQRDVTTVTRPGTMWEEVKPEAEATETTTEMPKIPSSAYVKPEAGPVELYKPEVTGKTRRAKMRKSIKENAPLDYTRGDYRENALPVGVQGPQGKVIRGRASGPMVQPELDFNMPSHEGGAQWLGMIQRGDSALVEKVRSQDKNWNYASTQQGRQSSSLFTAGDFIHHKRFGGGQVVDVKQAEHPITKQPDLLVSVDFGGTTKKGRPNLRTLSMADHGQLMEKRTSKAEAATEAETVKQNTETFDTRVAARKARKANGEE